MKSKGLEAKVMWDQSWSRRSTCVYQMDAVELRRSPFPNRNVSKYVHQDGKPPPPRDMRAYITAEGTNRRSLSHITSPSVNSVRVSEDAAAHFQTGRTLEPLQANWLPTDRLHCPCQPPK